MSITFREFVELVEGKKKEKKELLKGLKSAYLAGREQATPQIVNYGYSAPNSPERAAQVAAMMRMSGGGAVKKAIKQRENDAKKAAKRILSQEGFSYGNKSYQQELENIRRKAKERREKEAKKRREELYRQRIYGLGIRSVHRGKSGWIKDGMFTPDPDT